MGGAALTNGYTPEQLVKIRRAVAKGREAMRRNDSFTPLVFARAYVEHDGLQIPGDGADEQSRREYAKGLIEAVENAQSVHDDALIAREIRRIHMEVQWALASQSDKVVGFRLKLGREAERHPECLALLSSDRGLGTSVFRKGEVVILPPNCDGGEFVPVTEDEIEQ